MEEGTFWQRLGKREKEILSEILVCFKKLSVSMVEPL